MFASVFWGEDEEDEEELKKRERINLLILSRADWLKEEFEKSKTILLEALNSKKTIFSINTESFICRMLDDYADFYRRELFLSQEYTEEEYVELINNIRSVRHYVYNNQNNNEEIKINIKTKAASKMCKYYEKKYINDNVNLIELSKEYLKNENKI